MKSLFPSIPSFAGWFSGLLTLVLLLPSVVAADLRIASVFSDHMILQREMPVPVWGEADPNEKLTITFNGQSVPAVANAEGKWTAKLASMPANAKPQSLVVTSNKEGRKLEVQDILVGEIWLASGQSNMEWEMQMKEDSKADIPNTKHPEIRLLQIPLVTAVTPQESVDAKWAQSSPESAASFSAVGYYFGLKLHQELKIPIGIIQSAWGGTAIEPWTSLPGFEAVPQLQGLASSVRARSPGDKAYRQAQEEHLQAVQAWMKQQQDANSRNQAVPPIPAQPETLKPGPGTPTALYNAMIHPLCPFAIRGAIWYQGESNHGEGLGYIAKTEALLASWRQAFQRPDLPFYFVQIAPYQYGEEDPEILARFWVAQRDCLKLPHTGMAVITDIAEIPDIHPAQKKEVARRLSLWAMADTYGKKEIDPSGPLYRSFEVEGEKLRVQFDHVKKLKSANGSPLSHFELAGDDAVFHPATATPDGASVVIHSDQVKSPRQVRFGWSKLAMPNLVDEDGLPACAFHSHWPVDPELGSNFALGCAFVCSHPNTWNWNQGLTDGSWGNRNPQCFATSDSEEFPKTVTIDLKESRKLNCVRMGVPEIGSTKTVAVSLSKDNKTFQEVGTHRFGIGKAERAVLRFPEQESRYLRLTYLDHHQEPSGGFPVNFAFTSEVEAYLAR